MMTHGPDLMFRRATEETQKRRYDITCAGKLVAKNPRSILAALSVLWMAAPAAVALPSFYFPLDTGNTWVYRAAGPAGVLTKTVVVTGTEEVKGVRYAVVDGLFGNGALVRQDETGRLLVYDIFTNEEHLWIPLGDAEGTNFTTAAVDCTGTGTVGSRSYVHDGPIGHYTTAIEVNYVPSCADAGMTREVFLPWVGLLQRVETTIAGPRQWDLVYTSVGGNLFANASGLEFTLTLDQPSYKTDATILARFALRNWRAPSNPVELNFSSGQEYDVVIRDEKGAEVYRWSDGRFFAQFVHTITVSVEKNWVVPIALGKLNGGKGLAAGRYSAEVFLTSASQQREYLSRVGFTIE